MSTFFFSVVEKRFVCVSLKLGFGKKRPRENRSDLVFVVVFQNMLSLFFDSIFIISLMRR